MTDTYPDGSPLLSADAAYLQKRRDRLERARQRYERNWTSVNFRDLCSTKDDYRAAYLSICGAVCPDCDQGLVTLHDDEPADEAQAPTVGQCARCHGRGKIDPKTGD